MLASVFKIASHAMGNVAQVAQQRAAMTFLDVRRGTTTLAHTPQEIVDVLDIAPRARLLGNQLVLHVVDAVADVEQFQRPLSPWNVTPKALPPGPMGDQLSPSQVSALEPNSNATRCVSGVS